MKRLCAAIVILGALLWHVSSANAGERSVVCAGFPLPYGTSIAWTAPRGPLGANQRTSSVIAVAAVTTDDLRARAWIVWDEIGQGWVGLAKNSPADLRAFWIFKSSPDFNGKGIQVHFGPFNKPLPRKYRLTDCPDARPYEQ